MSLLLFALFYFLFLFVLSFVFSPEIQMPQDVDANRLELLKLHFIFLASQNRSTPKYGRNNNPQTFNE